VESSSEVSSDRLIARGDDHSLQGKANQLWKPQAAYSEMACLRDFENVHLPDAEG